MGAADGIKMGAKMLPIMGLLSKYGKITVRDYAAQFKNKLFRAAILSFMPQQYTMTGYMATLASMHQGDSGFPQGGSLPLARRMEQRYLELGGKLFYRSSVEEILVENGRAVGLRLADGNQVKADYVISCADGHATLHKLLGGKYLTDEINTLYSDSEAYPIYTTVQVSMGIACDLSKHPSMNIVQPSQTIDAGGIVHDMVGLKNYCFDPSMVPSGKSVVTTILAADYDWWKAKKEDAAAYKREKERVAAEVIAALEERYPETKGKVETVDVVTPMTYVRYCDAWRGAWMSFMTTPKQKTRYLPGNLPGLERFYMAGQWTLPPGGLPGAVLTGRWVIQRVVLGLGRKFMTAEPPA
jgi:phytoene desaturase